MAPINKKFRAVDAHKNQKATSTSSTPPPSSPSVSTTPSVIVRNDCQRVDVSGSYSSDSEQVDPRNILPPQSEKREAEATPDVPYQQDLPIDATIGATFDTRNRAPSDSASNDTNETASDHDAINNSHGLPSDGNNLVGTLFSPVSPPSPLQHHSQDSARRRNHSQNRHKHSEQQQQQQQQQHHHHHQHHHELHHLESSLNPEAPLHHQIHNRLNLHPQHLNIHNHMKDHHHHHQHNSNVSNPHCIIPSPSNSPFDQQSPQQQVSPFTFPFSPTSSAPSQSPSPASVITENTGHHHKDTGSGYIDSNGIRIRADNSNSEPFPYERSCKNIHSKRSTKSPPSLIPSEPHSHRHVSFRTDNVSPTPSKSSTNSDSHKSSSPGKGSLDKSSEEYRLRRERNNIAVRKSRSKSKVKFIQTIDRMNQLEEENSKLHARIDEMSRELIGLRLLVDRYQREDPRRIEHLKHLLAIEISQEITMMGRCPERGDENRFAALLPLTNGGFLTRR